MYNHIIPNVIMMELLALFIILDRVDLEYR